MLFRSVIITICFCYSSFAYAQSLTTEKLHKNHKDALSLYMYHNTLRMLNQNDDPDFDALIKDIEKMKLLLINKNAPSFNYKKLVSDYKAEAFEEVMTSRHQGKNFDVFFKEGKDKGMLVLVNDSASLYVLDIVGTIALDKITKLYNTIDDSSDIGKKIKAFTGSGNEAKGKDK
ncbi:DUF4252 domain-containing protein [Chryseosolibacter indicus]|uniref:DUF4252 domain-containing protein n=1 Tax=Chryseosolibacter indicus TaxID=2782351 RepID=A0ABS5VQS8_9BACT|nr:DUF4252 domain-containing protein [Chryseosolibacter indicus]MBT1703199.1 DUF4252 domain-containing protein [Chryseosolibacter indicus]